MGREFKKQIALLCAAAHEAVMADDADDWGGIEKALNKIFDAAHEAENRFKDGE